MELMQLEMFVAVAEGGSIAKASERVFRTQPAVSIAIKKLENEINAKLFDRSRRYEFRLTEVGEAFYSYATRLLSLRSEALSAVTELAQVRTGRLRVGANESISINLLPRLTQAFLGRFPGVQIEVQCDRSERLLRELKERRLDLALLSFVPDDDDLDAQFMMQDELVLIASPSIVLPAESGF
jgi:DNA-binding transcriptional LysR family regulator